MRRGRQYDISSNNDNLTVSEMVMIIFGKYSVKSYPIAQFAITINSNVCPHIRVLNMLMRDSYA